MNDPQRVQRALEVYEISGKPLTSFFQADEGEDLPYAYTKIVIEPRQRQTLHDKIAERFKLMLAQGLIDEVEALRQRGDLDESMPSIRCVGYRQVWSYLQGEYDFADTQEKGIAATRQLAKRQLTWLRKEQPDLRLFSEDGDLLAQVLNYCRQQANGF
jgi:tRNA dimethylallyltransferase